MADAVPTWLDAPPEGTSPSPPVATREQGLPFRSLAWSNFERLVLRLVRQETTVLDCQIYGNPGQAQFGIDVLGSTHSDRNICFQCKKVESFSAKEIKQAITKFIDGRFFKTAGELVLCVSVELESTQQVDEIERQRKRLEPHGIALTIWDASAGGRLSEKLKAQPILVDDFFGRPWVEAFNGNEAATALRDRLDAADLPKLRSKLADLYAVLFNQHDPGPMGPSGKSPDYVYRYVSADVLEGIPASIEAASSESAAETEAAEGSPHDTTGNTQSATRRVHGPPAGIENRRPILDWLKNQQSCVLLGEPGLGKSATMRHLALALLRHDASLAGRLSPDQLRRLPVWMSFAAFTHAIELDKGTNVEDHFKGWLHRYNFGEVQPLFERALRSSDILLLVDGLDEAVTPGLARIAIDRLVTFSQATGAIVLCTSRPRGFNAIGTPAEWTTANLATLTNGQIAELGARWFALANDDTSSRDRFEDSLLRARPRGEEFLSAVRSNPRTHQLAQAPLLCQALIEMFRKSPRLPEERSETYGEIVGLLLSRHPGARARAADNDFTERGDVSASEIRRVLVRLAHSLQERNLVIASIDYCESVCAQYFEDEQEGLGLRRPDAKRHATATVTDLIKRFGVLVERAPNELAFVHLSIQEYLAAEAIASLPEQEQLAWISDAWRKPEWRECLLSWFGLQGARGQRSLTKKAASQIEELGRDGEIERMFSLELRTELACCDLGLPVAEARRIIEAAERDVWMSPFTAHKVRLARSLVIGCLGSLVREECISAVRKCTIGRPALARAQVFRSLRHWGQSEDLKKALTLGLHDQDGNCRRAAGESLATIFGSHVAPYLQQVAERSVRPSVRAAALRGLGLIEDAANEAVACADLNMRTADPDLLFEALKIRVRHGMKSDDDRRLLMQIISQDSIDYWLKQELFDVLFEGWKGNEKVKAYFLQSHLSTGYRSDEEYILSYLAKAHPGDPEVREAICNEVSRRGAGLGFPYSLWRDIAIAFPGDDDLAQCIGKAKTEHRERYKALSWHPNAVAAYLVLGGDQARDELIDAYTNEKDGYDRYWIANTLFEGWRTDPIALKNLNEWARGDAKLATPLAEWGKWLIPDPTDRKEWLKRLIDAREPQISIKPMLTMLDEFASLETVDFIRTHLTEVATWYYNRVEVEARLAAADSSSDFSRETLKKALRELDGPPVAPWVKSVETDKTFRPAVLAAAVAAATEVRAAIASILRERMPSFEDIQELVPDYLAEEDGAVRTTIMIALGKGAGSSGDRVSDYVQTLQNELKSSGTFYTSRRLTALACLLEMGLGAQAAAEIAQLKSADWSSWFSSIERDATAVSSIVRHWPSFKAALIDHDLPSKLPTGVILHNGYGPLVDQSRELEAEIEDYSTKPSDSWSNGARLEHFANRMPRSRQLLSALLVAIGDSGHGSGELTAARILSQHFGGDESALNEVKQAVSLRRNGFADGVLGYLCIGWGQSAWTFDHQYPFGLRDRLLLAASANEEMKAEIAAMEMLEDPLRDWRYASEHTEALRAWAMRPVGTSTLSRWAKDSDATRSMTAIALLLDRGNASSLDREELMLRLNQEFNDAAPPSDGLNALTRKVTGWCLGVYESLTETRAA